MIFACLSPDRTVLVQNAYGGLDECATGATPADVHTGARTLASSHPLYART
jgi:hypothetical protein